LILYRGWLVKWLVAGVVVLVDEAEEGLLQADEVDADGEWRVAVAGQDLGGVEGRAEAEPGVVVGGGPGSG
jgi:hypothetical protein